MPISPPALSRIEEAAESARAVCDRKGGKLFWAGTGAALLHEAAGNQGTLVDGQAQPNAVELARFANSIERPSDYPAAPLYLRAPDAKPPKAPLFKT